MFKKVFFCFLFASPFLIAAETLANEDSPRTITPYYWRNSQTRPTCSYSASLNFQMGKVFEKSIMCSNGQSLRLKVMGTIPCNVFLFNTEFQQSTFYTSVFDFCRNIVQQSSDS